MLNFPVFIFSHYISTPCLLYYSIYFCYYFFPFNFNFFIYYCTLYNYCYSESCYKFAPRKSSLLLTLISSMRGMRCGLKKSFANSSRHVQTCPDVSGNHVIAVLRIKRASLCKTGLKMTSRLAFKAVGNEGQTCPVPQWSIYQSHKITHKTRPNQYWKVTVWPMSVTDQPAASRSLCWAEGHDVFRGRNRKITGTIRPTYKFLLNILGNTTCVCLIIREHASLWSLRETFFKHCE